MSVFNFLSFGKEGVTCLKNKMNMSWDDHKENLILMGAPSSCMITGSPQSPPVHLVRFFLKLYPDFTPFLFTQFFLHLPAEPSNLTLICNLMWFEVT